MHEFILKCILYIPYVAMETTRILSIIKAIQWTILSNLRVNWLITVLNDHMTKASWR